MSGTSKYMHQSQARSQGIAIGFMVCGDDNVSRMFQQHAQTCDGFRMEDGIIHWEPKNRK
jgi:hypothetical protein